MGRARHLSIGRFAGLTGISANTLRRYDECGLLSPAFTDPLTGYRLYAVEQLDRGIAIRLLRDLDVPLNDLRELMSGEQPDDVRALLAHHRKRIAERRAELERILDRIDAVLDDDHGLLPYELEVVDLAPVWVVSRRLATSRADLDPAIGRALAELILYANPLQWYQGLDAEVCLPVAESAAAACGARPLAGCRAARTVYRGPWDDIWQAYAALLAQIARRGLDVCGPVRESYLFDERDTDDPALYVTEIAWPVQPRAGAEVTSETTGGEAAAEPPARSWP